ncbi:MAG: hypothetical protein ABL921_21200 [Pirellula sp.]
MKVPYFVEFYARLLQQHARRYAKCIYQLANHRQGQLSLAIKNLGYFSSYCQELE